MSMGQRRTTSDSTFLTSGIPQLIGFRRLGMSLDHSAGAVKRIEGKWILWLGTFHGVSGLNSRDEIVSAVAVREKFKLK